MSRDNCAERWRVWKVAAVCSTLLWISAGCGGSDVSESASRPLHKIGPADATVVGVDANIVTIQLRYRSSPPTVGPCYREVRADVVETQALVTITIDEWGVPDDESHFCQTSATVEERRIQLTEPLGAKALAVNPSPGV